MNTAKKVDKSEIILKTAEDIIESEGLDGLSMNKVASKAGLAKGTLYLYFKNKEEIIGDITVKARQCLLKIFKEHCDHLEDPIKKIEQIFWADYYFAEHHRMYHELVSFYEKNTGLSEEGLLLESSTNISIYINSILEDAKSRGAIRQDVETQSTTFMFWGVVVGILQLLDTKEHYIQSFTGKNKKEFFDFFVQSTVASLT